MALSLYNKNDFINSLINEHEKGFSSFYELIEISKSKYGKEFSDAVWKHLSTNIEYTQTTEMVTLIESALQPYVLEKLNEKNNGNK